MFLSLTSSGAGAGLILSIGEAARGEGQGLLPSIPLGLDEEPRMLKVNAWHESLKTF